MAQFWNIMKWKRNNKAEFSRHRHSALSSQMNDTSFPSHTGLETCFPHLKLWLPGILSLWPVTLLHVKRNIGRYNFGHKGFATSCSKSLVTRAWLCAGDLPTFLFTWGEESGVGCTDVRLTLTATHIQRVRTMAQPMPCCLGLFPMPSLYCLNLKCTWTSMFLILFLRVWQIMKTPHAPDLNLSRAFTDWFVWFLLLLPSVLFFLHICESIKCAEIPPLFYEVLFHCVSGLSRASLLIYLLFLCHFSGTSNTPIQDDLQ